MSQYIMPSFGDFYGPGRGRGFGNPYALPMTPRGLSRMQPMGYYGMDQDYGGYGIGRGGFDMSRIYEGLPVPGYTPGYGEVGGETDYGFYPQDKGGGGGGGEETEEQRRARQIRENEEEARRDYGGRGGESSGRGPEVGSFGDWAGRMAEMARDAMQGAYQGDSSYGAGPGTGPAPGAPEPDPGGYSGSGSGGDYASGGIARRRYQDGGGADMRGQGRDQAEYGSFAEMINDPGFRGDLANLLDMASVGPARGFLEVSGLADRLGIGGGYGAVESAPVGEVSDSDRGASMAARGGSIHYASGGGGGREGDPRTETTEEASDAVYRWLKSFGLRPSKENIEIAEMAVYGTPPARSDAPPDLGGGIGYAVGGPGDGRADKIPAMLSDGEHIIPADVVSGLGRGSSKAGHEKLNQMILKERAKYRKTLGKLPPPKD